MTHSPDVDLVDSNRAQKLSFRTPASDLIKNARYLLIRKLALSATVIFLFALSGCGGGMSTGGTTPGSPGGPPPGSTSRNDLLKGQYAFSVASSFLRAAGSFTADGRGNISNGMEDLNAAGASAKTVTFAGTYSIGSDGRGTASLTGSNGASTLYFTMVSGSRARVMFLNSQADGVAATGTMDLQDPTAFSTSKIHGNYVFNFTGIGLKVFTGGRGSVLAMAGFWTMDGQGNISGEIDLNDSASGASVSVGGSYSVSANGRGTAKIISLGAIYTQTFAFYVVSANKLNFVETDAKPTVSGEVVTMASGPFAAATFKGGYAFTFSRMGTGYDGPAIAYGGVLTADGNGHLLGRADLNGLFGPVLGNSNFLAGYYVDATGRISTNIDGIYCDLFPAADGSFEIIETDVFGAGSGTLKAQVGAPFGTNSISGNFASSTGTFNLPMLVPPGEEDITGQFMTDGAGHLGGAIDVNQGPAGISTVAPSLSQNVAISAGTYSFMSNGYGSATLSTAIGSFKTQLYQVDNNTVFLMSSDPSTASIGLMEKQQF